SQHHSTFAPMLCAMIDNMHQEEAEMWTYLKSLSDEDMTSTLSYAVEDGTRERVLWHCLLHVVNHGTQHRSECAVMLTELEQSPGEIDFTVFTLTL
ncbi:MAG: DinB family protein, partial [Chloroflexota bacterium]